MSSVLDVIENRGFDLKKTDNYAAILGESPSKGAKSPSLWNTAFKQIRLSGIMYPMDVAPEKLEEVVKRLREDKRFIGGAVTMPYKISIIPYLDTLEPEAERIGAVNCLYREGERLVGANTDGAGALWSLQQAMTEPLDSKTVLLLGTGGAGFAVAAYMATAVGKKGRLILSNRSHDRLNKIAGRLSDICHIENILEWPVSLDRFGEVDVLINCTSIGFETLKRDETGAFTLKYYTPLGSVDDTVRVPCSSDVEKQYLKASTNLISTNLARTMDILAAMEDPFVFDIIYQPEETALLYLARQIGYRTLNGAPMNIEQAVMAFEKATVMSKMRDWDTDEVRRIMTEIW